MLRSAAPMHAKRMRMSANVPQDNVDVVPEERVGQRRLSQVSARVTRASVPTSQASTRVSQAPAPASLKANTQIGPSSSQQCSSFVIPKVPGRLVGVELQNFMCHSHLKLTFNAKDRNCFYIVGPNGSGKSALFAGINIALGGKGRSNDRGNSLQAYIKEGQTSAKVRVVLTNEGFGALPEYAEEIVVERNIGQTSSSYVIKSRRREGCVEEVKSRKKSDLDRILNRFSIDLENPLSWLSQDRSRQFLQSMKPDKLYEIFMISSDLQATKKNYEEIAAYQEEADAHVTAGENKKLQLKAEYENMLRRYKSGVKIEELGKRMLKTQWLLLWSEIRDKTEQIELENAKLEKLASKRAEFETNVTVFTDRKKALNNEKDDLIQKIEELRVEIGDAKGHLNQFQAAHNRAERDIANARQIIHGKQGELHAIDHEMNQTRQQLDQLMGNSNRDLVAEETQLNHEKAQTMIDLNELKERLEAAQSKLASIERTAKEKIKNQKDSEFELKELNSELERIAKDKQLYLSGQKNRLNLLGEDILKVKQLLQANSKQFSRLPIGPIGEYIKLRHQKWARPVEFCLRNVLGDFICDSAADRKLFERLCHQHRIKVPDLIITPFVDEKIDASANEPYDEFTTILRAIEVSNTTVHNVLIDQYSIENTLLLEEDRDARDLMYRNPPQNVRQAFTMQCSHVFPRQDNRPYRFYSNNNAPEARFLAADGISELGRRDFTREQLTIEQQIEEQQTVCEEAMRVATAAQDELRSAQEVCRTITRRNTDLENALRQLDEKNEELQKMLSSGTVIENFKATMAENAEVRAKIEEEIQNARHHLRDCEDEKTRIGLELAEAQNCLKRIDIQSRKIDAQLTDNSAKMEELLEEEANCTSKLAKCDHIRKKIDEKITGLMEDKALYTEKCVNEKGNYSQPEDYTDPPDFSQIPDTETLKANLKEYQQQKVTQEQINREEIPSVEQVENLRELGRKQNKRIKEFRSYLKRFSDAVEARREAFNLVKYAKPKELEEAFKEQMLMRNYNGVLEVDHEQKTIMISVETHKGNRDMRVQSDDENDENNLTHSQLARRRKFVGNSQVVRRNNQDLKGLSGGERSYTTACFVMALWSCVESPFRCLDEFDVFMDMLNRRVVMEMLVDLAMEYKRNQFFFFTPQGINELQSRNNIEIFNLPKVRDA